MSLAPSTCYHRPGARSAAEAALAAARLVERIRGICAGFPSYGCRRVTARLRAGGERVNPKRVARIMRERDPRARAARAAVRRDHRRGDHGGPILPNPAKDTVLTGPDQLRAADPTYIRILSGFVHLAVILDAWSRRVVGRAISRRIDRRRPGAGGTGGGDRRP